MNRKPHSKPMPETEFHELVIRTQSQRIKELEHAIKATLEENAHLADGDNCTLLHLVKAMKDEK